MAEVAGTMNRKTGEFVPAPSRCPGCGRGYDTGEVRHIMATMYECFCACGLQCVIHMHDGVKQS